MGWLRVLPIVAVPSQALNTDDGHFVDEVILGNNKNPVARGLNKISHGKDPVNYHV